MSAEEKWNKEILRISQIIQIPINILDKVNLSNLQNVITDIAPLELGGQKWNPLYEIPLIFQKVKNGAYSFNSNGSELEKKKKKKRWMQSV